MQAQVLQTARSKKTAGEGNSCAAGEPGIVGTSAYCMLSSHGRYVPVLYYRQWMQHDSLDTSVYGAQVSVSLSFSDAYLSIALSLGLLLYRAAQGPAVPAQPAAANGEDNGSKAEDATFEAFKRAAQALAGGQWLGLGWDGLSALLRCRTALVQSVLFLCCIHVACCSEHSIERVAHQACLSVVRKCQVLEFHAA